MRNWLFRSGPTDSPNRRIFRAALVVGLGIVTAKVGTTLKELVVAQWFGRSDALDAFLIAFLLPTFVLNVVVGALGSALIPTFVATRQKHGAEPAHRLFASVMLLSMALLAIITVLLAVFAPFYLRYLGSSFSPAKLRLTRELLYVILPFVFFNGILTCAAAVLNAGEKFAAAALAPLATPIVTIVLIEVGARRWGAFTLAAGVLIGSIFEATLVVRSLRAHGIPLSVKWYGLTPELRAVLGQYTPMLAATFLAGGTNVVDQSMAAMLRPGSVAALSYANKIVTVATALGVTALGTAVLPYFSQMVARQDWIGCRHTLKRYSVLVVLTSVPLTVVMMVFAKPIVRILFQRGSFNDSDTDLVSWVEMCYAIQIPFFIWVTLFVRFLSAIHKNSVLVYGAAINLILDIILNLALMRVMGIAGIALSTSIVYVVSFVFLSTWSMRLLAQRRLSLVAGPPGTEAEKVF
jgi:putative peptidoglycan lipid II flippase